MTYDTKVALKKPLKTPGQGGTSPSQENYRTIGLIILCFSLTISYVLMQEVAILKAWHFYWAFLFIPETNLRRINKKFTRLPSPRMQNVTRWTSVDNIQPPPPKKHNKNWEQLGIKWSYEEKWCCKVTWKLKLSNLKKNRPPLKTAFFSPFQKFKYFPLKNTFSNSFHTREYKYALDIPVPARHSGECTAPLCVSPKSLHYPQTLRQKRM